jgi:hypothetical protein
MGRENSLTFAFFPTMNGDLGSSPHPWDLTDCFSPPIPPQLPCLGCSPNIMDHNKKGVGEMVEGEVVVVVVVVCVCVWRGVGGCIAPTQPYRAALGSESKVCCTADRQSQWALTYCNLSQSTATQNETSTHCHRWGLNLLLSARNFTSLTNRPSPTPNIIILYY